jgi:aryl-alcohol dehydrogenase-like predicted oxidoreductase
MHTSVVNHLINKIILGTVQFGTDYGISNKAGQPGVEEINEIISLASLNGIDTYDTAPAYGESEIILGQVLPKSSKIVTKTSNINSMLKASEISDFLQSSFESSLNELNKDSIYGLLVHSADDLISSRGDHLYAWLKKIKSDSYVSKIGVSVYTADQIDFILDNYKIDIIQLPLNILDQRLIKSGHLKKLKDHNVEIHVRSVFLQGLLLMNYKTLPEYFSPYLNILNRFLKECKKRNLSALELSLGFVINQEEIDKVIVGVHGKEQLNEIITASSIYMPELERLSELASNEIELINPSVWTR